MATEITIFHKKNEITISLVDLCMQEQDGERKILTGDGDQLRQRRGRGLARAVRLRSGERRDAGSIPEIDCVSSSGFISTGFIPKK